jgi:hypothetical protein
MKVFKDKSGRTWELTVNVGTIRAVRDLLGIDLLKAFADNCKVYAEVVGDMVKLVDVAFVLCKKQAEAANITDENFAAGLDGDVIQAIATAFTDELVDFFPQAQRMMLGKLVTAMRTVATKLESQMQEAADELATSIGSEKSGKPPVPSASIQGI